MKQRGYIVRAHPGQVTVEHRASIRLRTIVIVTLAFFGYCLTPGMRQILVDFYKSPDLAMGSFTLLMLSLPVVCGLTYVRFASGEVMRCDARELQFARRRTWGRWHRLQFPSKQVQNLHSETRGSSKSRNYTVLTFQCEEARYDMLEDLTAEDTERVLQACRSMGLDAHIPVNDAAAMLSDIAERGWFVNPFRPDPPADVTEESK